MQRTGNPRVKFETRPNIGEDLWKLNFKVTQRKSPAHLRFFCQIGSYDINIWGMQNKMKTNSHKIRYHMVPFRIFLWDIPLTDCEKFALFGPRSLAISICLLCKGILIRRGKYSVWNWSWHFEGPAFTVWESTKKYQD